jgi:hypothetical protein
MTGHENLIGRIATLTIEGGLTVTVRILDVANQYGMIRAKVEPLEGKGQKWVNINRLTFNRE